LPRALARSVLRFAAADGRAGHCRHHDPVDVQRSIRRRERGARGPRTCAHFLVDAALDDVLRDSADRRWAVDPLVRPDPARRPAKPFEAARIDAASAWRTFRHITLPMLRPVMVVCIVIRSIDAFRTFDIVWTISGGGPARATELFSLYAYVESFQFLNLARGSAAAVIGAIIIVVFALLLYRILNRFVEVSK